ncbi:MAG TPA: phosphoglycerate kinase, partial [Bauldia sp.]|nr:phosphoglycerate kinase [Bauldia sp.]
MAAFRTLDGVDVRGKRVLIRVDLNVPMADGKVSDDTRIRAAAPTISEITDKGGKAILLAHFGRPKDGPDPKFTLKQVVPAVSAVLGRPVAFAADCVGMVAEQAVAAMKDGDVLVLENTRFHKGEEKNDPLFTAELAKLGDIYVNDAFSAAHRAHASTEGLANHLPAYAGRSMQKEIEALEAALGSPKRPVVAIVGGAKVSSKIDVLLHLVEKVDALVIGGGM